MRKIILMAAMMLSSVATFAQNATGQFSVMPKLGMSIADLTELDGSDARIGIVTGAELEYGVSDIFSLSAGALYSMQGCKGDHETLKLDYINIPILANVYVVKGLAVKLGIQPGFNVNSSYKKEGVETDVTGVKSVDFSIPVGLSYEINNFVIDGRYNWGLTKVADNGKPKNSVFQITLGYKFRL